MASHLVDLLWFWMGCRKIYHISGALDTVTDKRRDRSGEPMDVTASAFFSAAIAMEGKLDVQLSTTWAALGEERFDFSVYGTEGELHFDATNKLTGAFLSHRGTVKPISVSGVITEEEENRTTIFKASFVYFAHKIVEAVLTQSCEPVVDAATFEDAIPVQEVLEAIRISALEGKTVTMNVGYEPGARY